MQPAEPADSTATDTNAPGKTGQFSPQVPIFKVVDPFEKLSEVTCNQDVIGSLLDLAQTEIEDFESGRYYTVHDPHPLRRLSHLLYAVEALHRQEMKRVTQAEDRLLELRVPQMVRRAA